MTDGAPGLGSPRRPSLFLLGLLVALNALGIDTYVVALPTMQREFAVDPGAMQTSVSIYLAGLAAGQALWGWSSDRLGRRAPAIAALIVFVLGSIGCTLSATLPQLLGCRFLQAFGSAGAGAIAYAMVADHWPPDERPRVYSRLGQIVGGAAIVAPVIGSAILLVAAWRIIFALLAIQAGLTLLWLWAAADRDRPASANPAETGEGGAWRQLWTRPGFVPGLVAAALSNGAMVGMLTASSFVLVNEFVWTSGAYALFYAAASIAFIAACQVNVALLGRMPAATILVRACAAIVATTAILLLLSLSGRLTGGIYAGIGGLYLGLLGLVLGNAMAMAMASVPAAIAGRASSVLGVATFGIGAPIAALSTVSNRVSCSASIVMLGCSVVALAAAAAGRHALARGRSAKERL